MKDKNPHSESALRALAKSRIKNALSADPSLPPERRHLYRLESEALLSAGKKDLELDEQPGIGAGGEIPADLGDELGPFFRDTVKSPHLVTAKASRDRLELASDAGCLDLAIDAAETAGAKNSLEKMLMHQMAGAHSMAMRLLNQALQGRLSDANPAIMTKRVNAAARLMGMYQTGLQTLYKIRSGGRQHVIVQHVQVNDGGQAMVSGRIDTPKSSGADLGEAS